MGAHAAPQLQKETSEGAGAATTTGGACECSRTTGLFQGLRVSGSAVTVQLRFAYLPEQQAGSRPLYRSHSLAAALLNTQMPAATTPSRRPPSPRRARAMSRLCRCGCRMSIELPVCLAGNSALTNAAVQCHRLPRLAAAQLSPASPLANTPNPSNLHSNLHNHACRSRAPAPRCTRSRRAMRRAGRPWTRGPPPRPALQVGRLPATKGCREGGRGWNDGVRSRSAGAIRPAAGLMCRRSRGHQRCRRLGGGRGGGGRA